MPTTQNAYPTLRGTRPLMRQWVAEYLKYRTDEGDASGTLDYLRGLLYRFAEWYDRQALDPRELRVKDVRAFWEIARLKANGQPLAKSTHMAYRGRLNEFFDWLMSDEVDDDVTRLDSRPSLLKAIPRNRDTTVRTFEYLSAQQVGEVIQSASDYDRAVLVILGNTLCRRSSVVRLRVSDIRFDLGKVFVRNVKSGGKIIVQRMTPMFEREMRKWLTTLSDQAGRSLDDDDYVIPYRTSTAIFPDRRRDEKSLSPLVGKYLSPYIKQGGYDGKCHALRRACGQILIEDLVASGMTARAAVEVVQELYGHLKIETTLHYLQDTMGNMLAQEAMAGRDFLPDLSDTSNVTPIRVGVESVARRTVS